MKQYRWLLGLSAVAALALAACSRDVVPTDPGYYLYGKPASHLVDDPAQYMTAVGCTPLTGRPDTGATAIPLAVGRPAVFNCKNVNRDSVNAARARYYGAIAAAIGGSHIQTGYWIYTFVSSREWCYADGAWGSDGMFHLTSPDDGGTGIGACFWVDTYLPTWVSVTDPDYDPYHNDGGGGGDPTSPNLGDQQPVIPVMTSIAVLPTSATGNVGEDFGDFTATAHYGDGSYQTLGGPNLLWSSNAQTVAIPGSDQGSFHGVGGGTATVTASLGSVGGASGSATVTVMNPAAIDDTGTPDAGISSTLLSELPFDTFDCRIVPCPKPSTIIFNSAVLAMADSMARWTERTSIEHAVRVYWNSDGSFRFSSVIVGDSTGYHITIPPDDSMVGTIHGHWADMPPSGADTSYARSYHVYGIVGTLSYDYLINTNGSSYGKVARPIRKGP